MLTIKCILYVFKPFNLIEVFLWPNICLMLVTILRVLKQMYILQLL